MKSFVPARRIPWKVGALVFVLTGLALLFAAAILKAAEREVAYTITLNLGVAAIAIILVDALWRIVGGNPLDNQIAALDERLRELSRSVTVIDRARSVGLEDVYERQGDFGTQATWENLIRDSRTRMDLMARTAFGWTRSRHVADLIVERITRDGVAFRWLVMSRTNRYLPLLVEEDINIGSLLDRKLEAVEKFVLSIRSRLPTDKHLLFQVRTFDHVPLYCSILRTDDRWHLTHYMFSRSSDDSPLTCLHGADARWATAYAEEFELIWKNSTDLFAQIAPPSQTA